MNHMNSTAKCNRCGVEMNTNDAAWDEPGEGYRHRGECPRFRVPCTTCGEKDCICKAKVPNPMPPSFFRGYAGSRQQLDGDTWIRLADAEVFAQQNLGTQFVGKLWYGAAERAESLERERNHFRDAYERKLKAEACLLNDLDAVWHFSTCPYDHCERCVADESKIKAIRDRLCGQRSTREE